MSKQCGRSSRCAQNKHEQTRCATKHGLGSCMLGTRCHARASGFPSCPPCMALSGPSFALRSLWGKDCRKAPGKHQTWRSSCQLFPPAPAAFTSSSRAHTHLPQLLSAQPHHSPANAGISLAAGAGLGAQDTRQVPGSSHTHLEQVYLHSVCQLPVAVSAVVERLAHGGGLDNH